MRIVVDVTPLSLPRTGIGNYLRGMVKGLVSAAGAEHEIVAFGPAGPRKRRAIATALAGLRVQRRLLLVPPSAHVWRTAWSHLGWPHVEHLVGRLDVFHFSDWMFPAQQGGLRATTVYDLLPLHFPQWVAPRTERIHGRKYRNAARTCDRIFAISRFTADDVADSFPFPRERIHVAYPGVDDHFTPVGPRLDTGRPYILGVSTLEPRKNVETLVKAFALVRERRPEVTLAVVGPSVNWAQAFAVRGEGIRALGYVPDEELARLYRGASVFVYPSRFEGFGMPVVEAMASGTPVVASSHPSLDEAAGHAALRADPSSSEAFAEAIEKALDDGDRLRALGIEHARRFTWSACGEALLRGYATAL